MGHVPIGG
jgi:hypothetical protein